MLYFIEGIRGCGKTHLINSYFKDKWTLFKGYKFDYMNYYGKEFSNYNEKLLGSFSLGKDLQLLSLYQRSIIEDCLIVDRGILSTLAYGIRYRRFTDKEIESICRTLHKDFLLTSVEFIYINPGKNYYNQLSKRSKDDYNLFQEYTLEEQLEGFSKAIDSMSLFCNGDFRYIPITNNFDKDSEEKFKKTIKGQFIEYE